MKTRTASKASKDFNQADLKKIGAAYGGGFVRSHVMFGMKPHAVIAAPIAIGLYQGVPWNGSRSNVKGALSWDDGLANTRAMAEAGSKIAEKILGLKLGGLTWHLGARLQALAVHYSRDRAKLFAQGGAEFIAPGDPLWTSTQCGPDAGDAWAQSSLGSQYNWSKSNAFRALAVSLVILP